MVRSPVGEYPFWHIGTQVDPDGVEERHGEYVVVAESDGLAQGLGVHEPRGEEKLPSMQVRAMEPPVML